MIAICYAGRTAIGKLMGQFKDLSAPYLMSHVVESNPSRYTHSYIGQSIQAGSGQNPGRKAMILGGVSNKVSVSTVNKVCGSGMEAIAQAIKQISYDPQSVVFAGGMENMSYAPHLARRARHISKKGAIGKDVYCMDDEPDILLDSVDTEGLVCSTNRKSMGELAALLVKKYNIDRTQQDKFSLKSHKKAVKAADSGRFRKEIVPVNGVRKDECVRKDTTLAKLRKLEPVFGSTITAGNASPLSDGAAGLRLMDAELAEKKGEKVLGYIDGFTSVSGNPKWYTMMPVKAVRNLMKEKKLHERDVDLVELNEAFAVQSLAVMKELEFSERKYNVNGGAIALGHPVGCSGARIVGTLLHALRALKKERGIATLCIGGGEAMALQVRL